MGTDTLQAVILAAGDGSRLGALGKLNAKPTMYLKGHPLVDYVLDTIGRSRRFNRLITVTGHLDDKVVSVVGDNKQIFYSHNNDYMATGPMASLFKSINHWTSDADMVVFHGDVILQPENFSKISVTSNHEGVHVLVDQDWQTLWALRGLDPKQDAQSLKFGNGPQLTQIGEPTDNLDEIDGRFAGAMNISAKYLKQVQELYQNYSPSQTFRGKTKSQFDTVDFLQVLIDNGVPVYGVPTRGGWCEVKTLGDLQAYQKTADQGGLAWLDEMAGL